MFSEVLDVFICSIILNGISPWVSSSNEASLLLSKKDEDVVVVLEEAPVNLSKWSSSDDKSRLFARGTELESADVVDIFTSSSWAFEMGLMVVDDVTDGADGDGDFFELFSKVLTKVCVGRKIKKNEAE